MCQTKDSSANLLLGITLGAAIGAGAVFLFATPKGKQIRKKIHDSYPELFDQLDSSLSDLKEALGDRYEEVADQVQKIEETVSNVVTDEKENISDQVSEKVTGLGLQVENLGAKIQTMASTPKPHRLFRKKV